MTTSGLQPNPLTGLFSGKKRKDTQNPISQKNSKKSIIHLMYDIIKGLFIQLLITGFIMYLNRVYGFILLIVLIIVNKKDILFKIHQWYFNTQAENVSEARENDTPTWRVSDFEQQPEEKKPRKPIIFIPQKEE